MEDGECLSAKAGSQTLQRGKVLIHDFLRAEPALAHGMLLEAAHKVGEHAADAEPGEKVVSGDLARERAGDAAQEAGEVLGPNKQISNFNIPLTGAYLWLTTAQILLWIQINFLLTTGELRSPALDVRHLVQHDFWD